MKAAAISKSKPAAKPSFKAAAKPAAKPAARKHAPKRYLNGLPVVEVSDAQTEAVIAKMLKRNQAPRNAK